MRRRRARGLDFRSMEAIGDELVERQRECFTLRRRGELTLWFVFGWVRWEISRRPLFPPPG